MMLHLRRLFGPFIFGFIGIVLTTAVTPPVFADRTQGEWIIVRTPLSSESVTRLKNATNRAMDNRGAKKIIYQFQFAGASEYGPCQDFANYLLRDIKGRAETYAYIDKPLMGHAVLPALACNYLWLGPEGAIGKVNLKADAPIDKSEQIKYLEVAEARGKFPALILKMLYPELVVYQIDSVDGKKFKLDREQATRLGIDLRYALAPEEVNQDPKPILREQEGSLYKPSDEWTKNFGLWGRVYASPQQVVEALSLPGSIVQGNPLLNLDQPPRAAKIEVKDLSRGSVEALQRQINRAVEKDKVNCIIFEISASGGPGQVESADSLAKAIQALKDKNVLTVAYVPTSAKGAATFVAFACSHIVMGPRAQLGDCQSLVFDLRNNRPLPEREVSIYRDSLRNLADMQGYPPILAEGLLNPSLEIVKVQAKPDPNQREQPVTSFMEKTRADKEAQRWNLVETVKRKDKLLVFDTDKAVEWGIAWDKVDPATLDNVANLEGIDPKNVKGIRGGWLDDLAAFLAHPVTTVFLVIVFFTCIILEFKAPGIGVPAVIAAVSIVLVFWANSWLRGEINALAILLFLLGLVLLGVELFILPGFGVCGISGILLMLLGISLVVVQRWPETTEEYVDLGMNISIFAAGLLVSLFAAFILARYLPHVPYANRLILQPPDELTSDAGAPLPPAQSPALLGAIGVVVTTLRPAGKARFGDEFVDVVAEGSFVEPGARVQVIEIDGVHVVVKPV